MRLLMEADLVMMVMIGSFSPLEEVRVVIIKRLEYFCEIFRIGGFLKHVYDLFL